MTSPLELMRMKELVKIRDLHFQPLGLSTHKTFSMLKIVMLFSFVTLYFHAPLHQ